MLSQELNSLAEKLSYTEGQFGSDNIEVVRLKQYYSLLQIKDYLLSKKSPKSADKGRHLLFIFIQTRVTAPTARKRVMF